MERRLKQQTGPQGHLDSSRRWRQVATQPSESEAPARPRVLCVDDSPDVTRMLELLIAAETDLEDAGGVHSADNLVDEVLLRRVDVVVLDLTMPGQSPLDAIRALAQRAPSCRVIAFSGYDDVNTTEEALSAGAAELVSKHAQPVEIIRAIRRVAAGAE